MHLQVASAISQVWLRLGCITIHWLVAASSEVLVWGAFKKNFGMSVATVSPIASYYLVYMVQTRLSTWNMSPGAPVLYELYGAFAHTIFLRQKFLCLPRGPYGPHVRLHEPTAGIVLTTGGTCPDTHIPHVILVAPRIKVIGIHARWVVASMANENI